MQRHSNGPANPPGSADAANSDILSSKARGQGLDGTMVVLSQVERVAGGAGGVDVETLLGALATALDTAGDQGARVTVIEYYARLGLSIYFQREPSAASRLAGARLALHLAQALLVEERARAAQDAVIQGLMILDESDDRIAGELLRHLGSVAMAQSDLPAATQAYRLAAASFVAAQCYEEAAQIWLQLGLHAEAEQQWPDAVAAYENILRWQAASDGKLSQTAGERLVALAGHVEDMMQLRASLLLIARSANRSLDLRVASLMQLAAIDAAGQRHQMTRRHTREAARLLTTAISPDHDWRGLWLHTERASRISVAGGVPGAMLRALVQKAIIESATARADVATAYRELIAVIVAATRGDEVPKGVALAAVHILGPSATELRQAVEAIWAGQRLLPRLVQGKDATVALLIAVLLDEVSPS